MSSLASKITSALTPTSADDREVDAALDGVTNAKALQSSLYAKTEKQHALLATKRKALAEAALDAEETNDDTKYKRLQADIALLEAEVARTEQAQSAAGSRLHEAEVHLHAMGVAQHVKTARRLTVARTKAAASLIEALEAYATHYTKLHDINLRIIQSWPYGPVPQGDMLHPAEIALAVQNDLCRIKPIAPLIDGLSLPGARPLSPFIDQSKIVPLLQILEAANAHIIETVERGPNK